MSDLNRPRLLPTLSWVLLLSYFFANAEIQIEGAAGWAAALPTWRIEKGWMLDVFWGGRPMTGYHAWMFPFIALFFHFPFFFTGQWNWRAEARALACVMLFWVAEDFLWFILNPAYGFARFNPASIPWHKHWLWGVPTDYWTYSAAMLLLLWWSARRPQDRRTTGRSSGQSSAHSSGCASEQERDHMQ